MLTAIKLIDETVRGARLTTGLTPGELSMLLDIYNGTALMPGTIDRNALDLQVRDSFDLYPGMYEEKWRTDRTVMLGKIAGLSDWQAVCLQIWAVEFWSSGCYEEDDGLRRYVAGGLTPLSLLERVGDLLRRAVELQDKVKGAFRSKLVAEARTATAAAAEFVRRLSE